MTKKKLNTKTKRPGTKVARAGGHIVTPAGKPADMSMADYVRSVLSIVSPNGKTLGDQILEKQAALAVQGNSKAAEFLFDRGYGKPNQSITVTTPPQVVVEHNVINIDDIKNDT